MKFLVCADSLLAEELDAIANGLISNGHEVFGFSADIYKAYEEREVDHFIFSANNVNIPEIQTFLQKKKPGYLIVNSEQIFFSSGNSVNLPSFASTLKYKYQLSLKEFECDFAICFDGRDPEQIHSLYHSLYKKYKTKIIGAFINSPGYIGLGNPNDLVRLAQSAKITLCNNKIVTNSLIYNNIFATHNHPSPELLLSKSVEELEETVVTTKKTIITETKLGQIICEKLSNSNR
jgi:hypothetical protein